MRLRFAAMTACLALVLPALSHAAPMTTFDLTLTTGDTLSFKLATSFNASTYADAFNDEIFSNVPVTFDGMSDTADEVEFYNTMNAFDVQAGGNDFFVYQTSDFYTQTAGTDKFTARSFSDTATVNCEISWNAPKSRSPLAAFFQIPTLGQDCGGPTPAATPEPSTLLLLGTGVLAFGFASRKLFA